MTHTPIAPRAGSVPAMRAAFEPSARPAAIPLDDAVARSRQDRTSHPYVQGALALDLVPDRVLFGPQPTSSAHLPDPAQWANRLALVIAEVMTGRRPVAQLVRWTTPDVYAVISRRALVAASRRIGARGPSSPASRAEPGQPGAGGPRIAVRRVRVCEPADGVAEVAVVLQDGPRVRAMALRLSGFDGRWKVEALEIG